MNDVKLTVRPFVEEDREAVIGLWKTSGLVVPWNDPSKDVDRKLKVDRDLFLVGSVSVDGQVEKVVASVMGGYEGHRGWINYLAVDPAYRGRGFARKMMDEVEERLRGRGCPKINLQVRETNADVIAFYEHIGYRDDHVISLGKKLVDDTVKDM